MVVEGDAVKPVPLLLWILQKLTEAEYRFSSLWLSPNLAALPSPPRAGQVSCYSLRTIHRCLPSVKNTHRNMYPKSTKMFCYCSSMHKDKWPRLCWRLYGRNSDFLCFKTRCRRCGQTERLLFCVNNNQSLAADNFLHVVEYIRCISGIAYIIFRDRLNVMNMLGVFELIYSSCTEKTTQNYEMDVDVDCDYKVNFNHPQFGTTIDCVLYKSVLADLCNYFFHSNTLLKIRLKILFL